MSEFRNILQEIVKIARRDSTTEPEYNSLLIEGFVFAQWWEEKEKITPETVEFLKNHFLLAHNCFPSDVNITLSKNWIYTFIDKYTTEDETKILFKSIMGLINLYSTTLPKVDLTGLTYAVLTLMRKFNDNYYSKLYLIPDAYPAQYANLVYGYEKDTPIFEKKLDTLPMYCFFRVAFEP